jgi:siroheme synthase
VLSGHAESAWRPILGGIAPDALTLVVLMGLGSRAAIARFLRERGWRGDTPVAIALGASTPQAATWTGTLDEVAAGASPIDPPASHAARAGYDLAADGPEPRPGILVIGKVVSLAAVLSQTSQHPSFTAIEANRA